MTKKHIWKPGLSFFDDEELTDTHTSQVLADKGIALLKELTADLELQDGDSYTEGMDVKSLSFLIAGCEGFSHEEKQRFLEMTSTSERLQKSVESLENIIARMKITAEIHRIIGGNGNIKRFGASE